MLRALASGASGLNSTQLMMDVISNNLANVDTTAYKSQNANFADLVYQNIDPNDYPVTGGITDNTQNGEVGSGVQIAAVNPDMTQGALTQTGRSLDLAIDGPGYFQVTMPDAQVCYTRDGHFTLNAAGQITTSDGGVLSTSPPVTLPLDCQKLVISQDGKVIAQDGNGQDKVLGQINLYLFPNSEGLKAVGGNLYQATGASGTASTSVPGQGSAGQVVQGSLERSNVDLIQTMADMMYNERIYQFNARSVQVCDQMWSDANSLYS